MTWLLIFIPVAIALAHFAPHQHLWIFLSAALAIVPLAGWIAHATEQIARRTGEGVGGLLNATFGNAAELIIAIAALRAGLVEVVKASMVGSIMGNVLLVLGASMLAGGLGRSEQRYNPAGARSQATMLTLAVIALVGPAAFHHLVGRVEPVVEQASIGPLSVATSIVLLVVYGLNLVFELGTNRDLFVGEAAEAPATAEQPTWSATRAIGVLAAATALVAWMSEILVGAIEPAGEMLGLNVLFMGVFVVAILGNAAEHTTAVIAAMQNRMDLSLSIALGSSVQVALFVTPLLVLVSWFVGPQPMDLVFRPGLVLMVVMSVWIAGEVAGDGRSDWLRGVQLLTVYLLLGIAMFFVPDLPIP